jgi:hypothetical protein
MIRCTAIVPPRTSQQCLHQCRNSACSVYTDSNGTPHYLCGLHSRRERRETPRQVRPLVVRALVQSDDPQEHTA